MPRRSWSKGTQARWEVCVLPGGTWVCVDQGLLRGHHVGSSWEVAVDPSVCRRQPQAASPEAACILQAPGQGHGGPSLGAQSRRKCEQGILIEWEERRVSIERFQWGQRAEIHGVTKVQKKLSRELLYYLVNQHLPWDVVMETGRKGLDREPVKGQLGC